MLSSNKPHYHPRLHKPNLKTLLINSLIEIFQRNKFPKQYHAVTTVVRLLHRPKFQIFSTESNMMVKVVRYLPKSEADVHRCLQPSTEKRLFMTIVFTKIAGLQLKKETPPEMFSCDCA